MRNLLIPLLAAFALPTAVNAEEVYLILKSLAYSDSVSIISIPMSSMKSCESAGLKIISSVRFDIKDAERETFECIVKWNAY